MAREVATKLDGGVADFGRSRYQALRRHHTRFRRVIRARENSEVAGPPTS
jgi:hypothetical protein